MKSRVWIVFDRHGVDRMLKREPTSLGRGERVCTVDVAIDPALFEPPPQLKASIAIDAANAAEGQIVLDPQASLTTGAGDRGAHALIVMAARLLDKAVNSTDREIKSMAIDAISVCKDAGLKVVIEIPEPEEDAVG